LQASNTQLENYFSLHPDGNLLASAGLDWTSVKDLGHLESFGSSRQSRNGRFPTLVSEYKLGWKSINSGSFFPQRESACFESNDQHA
jgi:hypothetical protein